MNITNKKKKYFQNIYAIFYHNWLVDSQLFILIIVDSKLYELAEGIENKIH